MKIKTRLWVIGIMILILASVLTGCAGLAARLDEALDQGVSGPYHNGWWGPYIGNSQKIVNVSFNNIKRVATFVISGVAPNFWDADIRWAYTADLDKRYSYEFEAWTEKGTMVVNLWHHGYQFPPITVTPEHKTFKLESPVYPAVTNDCVTFQFGNQIGTLNIKMISIKSIKEAALQPGTFKNPYYNTGADPFLFYHDGWYYYTSTTGGNVTLVRSRSLRDFEKNAEKKVIWTPTPGRENSTGIGSPEIHYLDGKWWCYHGATNPDGSVGHTFVLEHIGGGDLWGGTWAEKGKIVQVGRYDLDGTVVLINDQYYYVYSGLEGDSVDAQNLYIAKMASPWQLEGNAVIISRPEHDWEKSMLPGAVPGINEGPAALYTGNYVGILFSGSVYYDEKYCLGLIRIERGEDPMDPEKWAKPDHPLLQSEAEISIYGPGHCSIFTSPDGTERWISYHAYMGKPADAPHRLPFAMPFTLDEDEMPVFGKPADPKATLPVPSGDPAETEAAKQMK